MGLSNIELFCSDLSPTSVSLFTCMLPIQLSSAARLPLCPPIVCQRALHAQFQTVYTTFSICPCHIRQRPGVGIRWEVDIRRAVASLCPAWVYTRIRRGNLNSFPKQAFWGLRLGWFYVPCMRRDHRHQDLMTMYQTFFLHYPFFFTLHNALWRLWLHHMAASSLIAARVKLWWSPRWHRKWKSTDCSLLTFLFL